MKVDKIFSEETFISVIGTAVAIISVSIALIFLIVLFYLITGGCE